MSISNFLSSPCPPFSLRPFVRFIVTLPGQTPVHHEHKRREREQKERGMKNGSRKSDDPIIMAETGKHHSNDRARNCLSPGCAASKSQLKLQRNRSDHIFSHFSRTFCRSERREEDTSVSIYGLGGLGSASLVSIPSVHFRSLFLLHVNCFRIWHPDFPQIPYPAGSLPPPLSTGDLFLSLRFH